VAKRMAENQLRVLALVGAQVRLHALQAEIAALLATFPELRSGRAAHASAAPAPAARGRGGRKRPMSAAEKKIVSERMKKYWAERRAEKGAKK
jgi:hypothetical protein